jgi:hypothetical protein
MTRERFLERVDSATNGIQLLELLTFLPNTAQRWGHSITMNAVIKILCCSPTFKDQCEPFYAVKAKKGVDKGSINLHWSHQSAVFNAVTQLTPTYGPCDQVRQLLRHCDEAFNESTVSVKQAG